MSTGHTPKCKEDGCRSAFIAVLVTMAALAFGLAACGGGGGGGTEGGNTETVPEVELEGKPSGELTISNQPRYIDKKTVPDFEKATGVKVKYIEDVKSNEEFFGKMQPLLQQGESGGRSLFIVTDWMAKKMRDLGYLQTLDATLLPAVVKNLQVELETRPLDPNEEFSVPWQSGMTGIIVRKDLAPEIHSICDLFSSKYTGRVDFLADMHDTVPLVMKCEGIDPNEAKEADWLRAIDKIKTAAESGQIRRFTGDDNASDLTNGNAVAAISQSGDAVQLQIENPNVEWRMPTEGCILWSDEMVIPVGAPNPTAAEAWINYVYRPRHQAQILAATNHVTPAIAARKIVEKTDPALAKNQLVFPSHSFMEGCSPQPTLSGSEEQRVTRAFDAVLHG